MHNLLCLHFIKSRPLGNGRPGKYSWNGYVRKFEIAGSLVSSSRPFLLVIFCLIITLRVPCFSHPTFFVTRQWTRRSLRLGHNLAAGSSPSHYTLRSFSSLLWAIVCTTLLVNGGSFRSGFCRGSTIAHPIFDPCTTSPPSGWCGPEFCFFFFLCRFYLFSSYLFLVLCLIFLIFSLALILF